MLIYLVSDHRTCLEEWYTSCYTRNKTFDCPECRSVIQLGGIYDIWGRNGSIFSLSLNEEKANLILDKLVAETENVRKAMGSYEALKSELDCQIIYGDDQLRNNLNNHIPGVHYTDALKKFAGQMMSGMTAMAAHYGIEEEVKTIFTQVIEFIQAEDPLVRKALLDTTNGGISTADYLGLTRTTPTHYERPVLEAVKKACEYSAYTIGHEGQEFKEHMKLVEGRLGLFRDSNKIVDQGYMVLSKKLRLKYHMRRLEENYADIPALQSIVTLSSPESGPNGGKVNQRWSPIITRVQTVEGDVNIGASTSAGASGSRPRPKRSRNEAEFSSETDD